MLESFCDRLHGQVERNLDEFLDPNMLDRAPFYKYRDAMKTLSTSTNQFYHNMLEGIEEL
jgi:hypothetical protein